jgi:hypothetical protein
MTDAVWVVAGAIVNTALATTPDAIASLFMPLTRHVVAPGV